MPRFGKGAARFSMLIVVSLGPAVFVPGCAGDTVLADEDYDQSCKTEADCETVLVGDMCGCSCDWGVIAKSELPKFQADDAAAREACGSSIHMCGPCPNSPVAACVSGKCSLTP